MPHNLTARYRSKDERPMKPERLIDRYDCYFFDLDGVVYLKDKPIASAVRFLSYIKGEKKRVLFLTNNSMFGVEHYRRKLSHFGIEARRKEIATSSMVMREYLTKKAALFGETVMVIGGRALIAEVEKVPLRVLRGEERKQADIVVVGWDMHLTYEKLRDACLAISSGAVFLATNDDATYPTPDGKWPGAGSIVAALVKATGVKPVVIGKPYKPMMEYALKMAGCPKDRILMVGDRLDTDILGGKRAGLATCLVLTGISSQKDLIKAEVKPDIVVSDLMMLTKRGSDDPSQR